MFVLACAMAVSMMIPADAEAQFFGALSGYRWNYVQRHMEFSLAHSVMTDRVVFDDQGYIDLALTDLHPLAVRDMFPYPWLFSDDQLRELNYNPILFWSIPTYLPSYDEMRRIYTLDGGYFFDPWGSFYGGFWERAWAGYYGRFPYDMYWGWWQYNFYFVDYPYGGWWMSGWRAMDTLSAQLDSVQVKKKAGWPVGLWVREPLPSALASADLGGMSVQETMALAGKSDEFYLPGGEAAAEQVKNDRQPRITRAYRDFLPQPGPESEDRRSVGGDVGQGSPSSSSGSISSSGSSGGGLKRKTKQK
jgi:hypothetical protein